MSAYNAIGESISNSTEVASFAQSLPGVVDAPIRVSSEVDPDDGSGTLTASITLRWSPLFDTGGVPLTGYKLYALHIDTDTTSLVFDGTDRPEITETTVSGLELDADYSFYVTGLNPFESPDGMMSTTYRAGGRPGAPGQITEVSDSRTGTRIGLEWSEPTNDGGSAILAYSLVLTRENMDDVVLYYGS